MSSHCGMQHLPLSKDTEIRASIVFENVFFILDALFGGGHL